MYIMMFWVVFFYDFDRAIQQTVARQNIATHVALWRLFCRHKGAVNLRSRDWRKFCFGEAK